MSGRTLWRTTLPTERLFSNPKFQRLGSDGQHILFRMYARCCRWGRGPGGFDALWFQLGLHQDFKGDLNKIRDQLHECGFIEVYEVDGESYYQIANYDEDAFGDLTRKRRPSPFPVKDIHLLPKAPKPKPMQGVLPDNLGQIWPVDASPQIHNPRSDTVLMRADGPVITAINSAPRKAVVESQTQPGICQTETGRYRDRDGYYIQDLCQEKDLSTPAGASAPAHTYTHAYEPNEPEPTPTVDPDQPPGFDGKAQEMPPERIVTPRPTPALDLTQEKPYKAPPRAEFPNAECEREASEWYDKLNSLRPTGHAYTWDDVKRVAMEYPEDFVAASQNMRSGTRGWAKVDTIKWLSQACWYMRDKRLDAEKRAADAAKAGPTPRQGANPIPAVADPARMGPAPDDGPWVKWLKPGNMTSQELRALPKAVTAWFAIGGMDDASWVSYRDKKAPGVKVTDDPVMLAWYAQDVKCTVEDIHAARETARDVYRKHCPPKVQASDGEAAASDAKVPNTGTGGMR